MEEIVLCKILQMPVWSGREGVSVLSGAREAGELAGGDTVLLARVPREQAQVDLVV